MAYPGGESHTGTTLKEKTFFNIRMYEVLFFSAFFCFVYSLYHTSIVLWIVFFTGVYLAYRNLMTHITENLPVNNKAVLITGCDSGYGLELAKDLLAKNFQVFAGCLNPDEGGALELKSMDCSRLYLMKLNVIDDESITECANIVQEICCEKGLWALVNNASVDMCGAVEFSTIDMFEKVMDVNYFGTVRVTKTFLPFIRKAKGRILNVSSFYGKFAVPNRAAYCPSKFAVEAFSDILRMEVKPFGIKVCLIEPCHYGGFSKILDSESFLDSYLEHLWDTAPEDVRTTYGRDYLYHLSKLVEDERQNGHTNTRPITEAMYHAILSPAPKFRYFIRGRQFFIDTNTVLGYAVNVLPEAAMDFIVRSIYLNNWPIPQSLKK